ncbi:MAG: hypothetical protein WAT39_20955 [Planctomycetota bacterium]
MNERTKMTMSALLLLAGLTLAIPVTAQEPGDAGRDARVERLRAAGVAAPLTLFPIRVLGKTNANVAEALGLVLERHGMPDLQVADQPFDPATAEWAAVPAAFGAHVRGLAAATPPRHSLYAEFLGDPKQGPTEVRFIVVDPQGEVVLVDRQTPTDATFQRTAGRDPDPLGCATLVGERLFELANWRKVKGGVRDGKFAARWQQKSGAPDKKERAAMDKRLAAARAGLATASFAVFSPLWGNAGDVDAVRFVEAVAKGLGCKAAAPVAGTLTVAPASNQQKRLFDLAAAVKAALGKQPIDADYAVAMDCGLDPAGKSGFVNLVVLTKAGELVLADYQNDQHPLFQQHAPKVLADGEKLAVARLVALLK